MSLESDLKKITEGDNSKLELTLLQIPSVIREFESNLLSNNIYLEGLEKRANEIKLCHETTVAVDTTLTNEQKRKSSLATLLFNDKEYQDTILKLSEKKTENKRAQIEISYYHSLSSALKSIASLRSSEAQI